MKKHTISVILLTLLFIILGNGIIYLLMSFVCLDLNVGKWNDLPRIFLGFLFFCWICFAPFVAFLTLTFNIIDDE